MAEESLDSMHDDSMHALSEKIDDAFTKQSNEREAAHEDTRQFVSDLFVAHLGKVPAADGGTLKEARDAIRRDEEKAKNEFKLRKDAVRVQEAQDKAARDAARLAKAKAKAKGRARA